MTDRAAWARPLSVRNVLERREHAVRVVGGGARLAAQQLPALLTHAAELHVLVLLILAICSSRCHGDAGFALGWTVLLTVRAAPLALGRLLQLRLQAH